MSLVKIAAGDQIKVGDGASPENFVVIPELKEYDLPEIKVDMEEATNQDSPMLNGLIYKEWLAGLADGTEATFTGNYLPTDNTQKLVRTYQDGKAHNFQVVIRDITQSPIAILTTFSFAAFVTSWQPKRQIGKPSQLTFKVKVTGAVTQS